MARFLSVEVAIRTDANCDAFIDWFSSQDNHVEKRPGGAHRWYVYFAPIPCDTADLTIRKLCAGIPDWPSEVRRQWNDAAIREFYVGYEVVPRGFHFQDRLEPATLTEAANVGAGIGIAIYAPEE